MYIYPIYIPNIDYIYLTSIYHIYIIYVCIHVYIYVYVYIDKDNISSWFCFSD